MPREMLAADTWTGNQRHWADLKNTMLRPGESIEFRVPNRRLIIRATKANAAAVLDRLDRVVGSIRAQSFPLRFVSSAIPNDDTLAELSRITNTYVSLAHNNGEVR